MSSSYEEKIIKILKKEKIKFQREKNLFRFKKRQIQIWFLYTKY